MPSVRGGAWLREPVRGEPSVAGIPRDAGPAPVPRDAVNEPTHRGTLHAALATMRPKQWIKNTLVLAAAGILIGQEKEDRTLLSQQQMTAIINEVSGERAMHHVRYRIRPKMKIHAPIVVAGLMA